MVKNLLDHGTVFNAKDKNYADDLLNLDITDGIHINESDTLDKTFEDED